MENDQPNYYKADEPEPILTEEDGDNEDDELGSFFQEFIYPELGCIDTLMNPNPNPSPEEDGPAIEVVQPKNGGDGLVDDQPSSRESSSSAVNSNEPISRSNLGDSPMIVQATRVFKLDQVMLMNNAASLGSSVDTSGHDPIEKKHISNPNRKKPIGWTNEEHTAFLIGIRDGYSGDWKYMSQKYVTTRSPTQIASHAQKYFKRQQSGNPKRRKSINDITLSDTSIQTRVEQPTAAAETRVNSSAVDQQAPPSFYNIRQSAPNSLPQPNPNPNPNWVFPVRTDLIQQPLPPRPVPEEARLYMARQRHHESSSSSSRYIPSHVPVLSPLPQQIVPPNYSLNPHEIHAYHSAQRVWRSSTIQHNPHHQLQTLTSSWPLQQRNYRSYGDYYLSSIMPRMFNSTDLPLQQSLCSRPDNNAVNDTSQLTFSNVDMGPAPPLPADQDSKNINFYP